MADVIPKLKMLIFLSIIATLINISVNICSNIESNLNQSETKPIDLQDLGVGFIPFVSVVSSLEMPDNPLKTLFIFITIMISTIQTFVISMIVISLLSNLLYHPDV